MRLNFHSDSFTFRFLFFTTKSQRINSHLFLRIFPTNETWNNYGALLEYSSSNNLILHENLFPDVLMKPANRVSDLFMRGADKKEIF